jgi:REP element-mobilizing transposase RayT
LTDIGCKVEKSILFINEKYQYTHVDKYVIMPNHIHMIAVIDREAGGPGAPPLLEVIGRMKSFTTHQFGKILWQESFHDHVIRNKKEYLKIWKYIDENPIKWTLDKYYMA